MISGIENIFDLQIKSIFVSYIWLYIHEIHIKMYPIFSTFQGVFNIKNLF